MSDDRQVAVLHYLHCDKCGTSGPKVELEATGERSGAELMSLMALSDHADCEGVPLLRHERVGPTRPEEVGWRHLVGPETPRIPCHGGPLDGELQPDVSMRLVSPNWEGHYRIAADAEGHGVSWEWDRGIIEHFGG